MSWLRRTPIAWIGAIAMSSCGGGQPPGMQVAPIEDAEITVAVENRNFSDATIYAVDGPLRKRVGRVTGKTTRTFTFRWENERLQMLVDFMAGPQRRSGQHTLIPGQDDDLLLIIGVTMNSGVVLTKRRS